MWHLLVHLIRPLISAASDELTERNEESFLNVVNPSKFIGYLKKMGYFKYADSSNAISIENSLAMSFIQNNGFVSVCNENSNTPLDYRIYKLNGELLLEKAGLINSLKRIKLSFDKMLIPLLWTNESMVLIGNQMDYKISLNGKDYVVYKGDKDSTNRAGIMKSKIVEMLNDQLIINKSAERIYMISTVNEGMIAFLTKPMHSYIEGVIKNKNIQPLDSKMWAKWNRLI